MGARGTSASGEGGPGIAGGATLSSPGRRRGERRDGWRAGELPGKLTFLGVAAPGVRPGPGPGAAGEGGPWVRGRGRRAEEGAAGQAFPRLGSSCAHVRVSP